MWRRLKARDSCKLGGVGTRWAAVWWAKDFNFLRKIGSKREERRKMERGGGGSEFYNHQIPLEAKRREGLGLRGEGKVYTCGQTTIHGSSLPLAWSEEAGCRHNSWTLQSHFLSSTGIIKVKKYCATAG